MVVRRCIEVAGYRLSRERQRQSSTMGWCRCCAVSLLVWCAACKVLPKTDGLQSEHRVATR